VSKDPKCLNCNSADSEHFLMAVDMFGDVHSYFKCQECGLVYLWPLPDDITLAKVYDRDYYGEGEKEKFRNDAVVKMISFFSGRRARRFGHHLKPEARIMDVGCGNGRFLEHLYKLRKKFELNGIEISAKAALRASERLKAKAWIHTVPDIERFFGPNSFDAVSYIHVFEHIANPAEVMDQLKKVVRQDGVVMIVIPNIESRQFSEYKHNWFHLDPPRHLHFYPRFLLVEEMKKRDFELISSRYLDLEQNPFGEVQSLLNTIFTKRDVLFERLKGNKQYASQYKWFSIVMMKLFSFLMIPLCVFGDVIACKGKRNATFEMIFKKMS
jgi:2-polyprenyl-3-methyl-5-hydroxy-6-metoxy-1,4-benzoquinol methylase